MTVTSKPLDSLFYSDSKNNFWSCHAAILFSVQGFARRFGVVFLCAFQARGQSVNREDNWPHWRGPDANGTAPKADPPLIWDAKTNIKWKAALPGSGTATPIVWGDQVFVLAAIKTDRVAGPADLPKIDPKLEVKTTPPKNFLPIRRAQLRSSHRQGTLAKEWPPRRFRTKGIIRPTPTPPARRPPMAAFFMSPSALSAIYCYDLDGKLQWQRDLGRLNTRLGWGEAVTPVVHGDSLLLELGPGSGFSAHLPGAPTGKTKWRAQRDEKTSWNTPLVVEHKGKPR